MFLLCVTAHAQNKPASAALSAVDRQHVMQDAFVVSRTTAAIPGSVKQAWVSYTHETQFRMAEPGKPFQESDVVRDASLPWKRLRFVAVSKDMCVLQYERGGIFYSPVVAVFHLTGDKATLVYADQSRNIYAGMNELRRDIDKQHILAKPAINLI